MEVKPGYKQTEIGIVPETWEVVELGKLFSFKNGLNKAKQFFGYGTPIVNYMDVYTKRGLRKKDIAGRVSLSSQEIDNYRVMIGDVLFTRTSETSEEVGISSVVLDELEDTVFSGFVLRARPITTKLQPLFAQYCFSPTHVRKQVISKSTYTTRALTNGKSLSSVVIAIPSTNNEQSNIANSISDIDILITSLEKLIKKKKLIKQGVMQELLTGKRRLPGFSGEWETKRLGDVSVVIMGQSPDSKYYNTDSKGIPLIQGNADIQNGKSVSRIWTKSITKECQKGAILITVRAPVGSVGISSSRACLGRGVCAVQPYSVNERYLYWQLKFSEDKWNESQQGSTFTSVNSNQIKDFCILCPTSFDEQAAIADVIEDIEIEIDLHIKQLNKQILLKQAMMQELLTGRIRLV
jgi:type I restriction enzyme S subunit